MRVVKGFPRPAFLLMMLATLALALPALAGDVPEDARAFLKSWADKMRGVRSLRVEFDQTKELRILRKPLVSHGVALLKGKRLLMTVTKDGEKETELAVDVEKGEARLHYPRLKRVEVVEIGKGSGSAAASTPFPIFGGDVEALPESHDVRLLHEKKDGKDVEVLVLSPKEKPGSGSGSGSNGEMRLTFLDGTIACVEQANAKGDKVRIEIRRFETGVEVEDKSVELSVPEGTKVVKILGDAAPVTSTGKGNE